MIPVTPKPEPAAFDAKVRQPGQTWLKAENVTIDPATWPKGSDYPNHWKHCREDMLSAYGRICAYAALYIEKVTGAPSTDHFAPKSKSPFDAYEWSNYRLACMRMNSCKNNFEDVLDPFSLPAGTFRLAILDGEITWNHLSGPLKEAAKDTVTRLGLNDSDVKERRFEDMERYLVKRWPVGYIKERNPFVYLELQRQGLLRVGD